jgi:hypothetical protein
LCDSIMSLKALMWLSLFLSNKKYTKWDWIHWINDMNVTWGQF